MHHFKNVIAAAAATLLPLVATAGVIFSTGNTPGGDNVVFNPCAAEVTSGTTVSGCLNTDQSTYVTFTGTESLTVNGGQARVEAADGAFNSLLIQMASATLGFTQIVFNINTDSTDPTGSIAILANLFSPGSAASYTQSFSVANGQNFFTVISNGGDVIQSLSFASDVGVNSVSFQDTRQVRIGVADAPANVCPPGTIGTPPNCIPDRNDVPEPGSLALVGLAIAAAGVTARRRRG